MEIFAVCVITFEPIKIQTCSSPQNDRLNLSFVKDIKVIGKKPTRYGHKMEFCQLQRPFMRYLVQSEYNFVRSCTEYSIHIVLSEMIN